MEARVVIPVVLLFIFACDGLCQSAPETLGADTATCVSRNLPRFSDYAVRSVFSGQPKKPILRTALDHEFRTTIRDAARKGANFAGHYAVALWGCGTGCHGFAVVDLITAEVFDPPFRNINFHTPPPDAFVDSDPKWFCVPDVVAFRKTSSLLVVEGCLDDNQCGRTYYVMQHSGLRQIAYDPDLLPDGSIAPQ